MSLKNAKNSSKEFSRNSKVKKILGSIVEYQDAKTRLAS